MRLRHDGFRDCPEERSARLYRGSGPIGPPWDAAFAETVAAFLASHQSWPEQPRSLHLAIPQKGPLWSWCFEDKKSPRSIDSGRGAQERETQHRCGSWNETLPRLRTPRRHRLEAQGFRLPFGPVGRLAQNEEPSGTGGEAGSGGGLGEMTRRNREIVGLANEQDFPHLVELALPPEAFRSVFLEIDTFHRDR